MKKKEAIIGTYRIVFNDHPVQQCGNSIEAANVQACRPQTENSLF